MTTINELKARRAKLVADRADCELAGLPTVGVDIAIFNVDRALQDALGDEDEPGTVSVVGDIVLMVAGVVLLIGAAVMYWWP